MIMFVIVLLSAAAGGFIGWFAYEMGAKEERAKIVVHIRQVADRIENDPDGIAWFHLLAMAIVIEAGEHLK
jgi:hypothetical protein